MAGGVGTRFWPISRSSMPKQFLDILGTGKSFIRQTYERFVKIIPAENFLVVANERYRDLVLEHIPELTPDQILCEPIGRNTAPCVAYAAYTLLSKNPDAEMVITPSDHLILNESEFCSIVNEAFDFASNNKALMTIGINPTRPETGYGYIQMSNSEPISKVKCFTEKPNLELAQTFVECGEFLWNSGIFIWTLDSIVKAFEEYLPEHHQLFSAIATTPEEQLQSVVERAFSECRAISIDYGIMEKADNVYVRNGDFGWSDVGTWGSVYQHSNKDESDNAKSHGECLTYNTKGTIIQVPEGKVAVINGLEEYIVVDTKDVLMICPRSEEQNIKTFIDEVRFKSGDKFI